MGFIMSNLAAPLNGSEANMSYGVLPDGDPCAAILGAPTDRAYVVAQLGQSLDGRIATPSGESRWINRQAALDHLHRLRAAVDAVVVGIGTVVADDPVLNVRRVSGRNPARVVIDPAGRLPAHARCLADDGARRLVVRGRGGPAPEGVEVLRLNCEGGTLAPEAIVAALFDRGLRRLLIEGGARTVSRFIDAEAVDRLHILVAPMILGCGKIGLELSPIAKLSQARRPCTRVHLLEDGDVLFDCDLRAAPEAFDKGWRR
jgi:diaminohydroxyphosphoribosylaminopyrimidine deaminase/5-amino-6-(5-phosphoribosylamino)uracil reductase